MLDIPNFDKELHYEATEIWIILSTAAAPYFSLTYLKTRIDCINVIKLT